MLQPGAPIGLVPSPGALPAALRRRAMSASEIVKRAGSIGAASGGFWSRRRSQARSSSRSSRSAAFRNASKNRWRCAASSRAQPCIVASVRSMRRISRALKRNSAKENRKTKNANMLKWCGRAVPAPIATYQRDPKTEWRPSLPAHTLRKPNRSPATLDDYQSKIDCHFPRFGLPAAAHVIGA